VLWCGELCHGRGKAVVMGITTSKPSMSQLSGGSGITRWTGSLHDWPMPRHFCLLAVIATRSSITVHQHHEFRHCRAS
jgi:hypothetical protein